MDTFASHESSHCQLYFSPRHRRTGTQLASGFTQVWVSPSEPTRTDTVRPQGGRGAGPAGRTVLAHPDLVSRTHFPHDSPSLAHSSEEGPSFHRGSAPYGTRIQICGTFVQICGNFMCGSWTGRDRLEWSTTGRVCS